MHENTWKCGELKALFFSHPPEDNKKRKQKKEVFLAALFAIYLLL